MQFYPSIENAYQNKFIDMFTYIYPELINCQYIIQEKIHGSNFIVHFEKDGTFVIGKRHAEIGDGKDNFGSKEVFSTMTTFIDIVQKYISSHQHTLTFHGEVFGKGVQKGINYGEKKRILFFDMRVDDELLPQNVFQEFMQNIGLEEYVVPTRGVITSLQKALEWNETFISELGPNDPENIAEGIVIKPLEKQYFAPSGDIFYLKKKPLKWRENGKEKQIKEQKPKILNKLLPYITENRVASVLSKEGPITSKNQIGKLAPLIVQDAIIDFKKDFPDEPILKEYEKGCMSVAAQFLIKAM